MSFFLRHGRVLAPNYPRALRRVRFASQLKHADRDSGHLSSSHSFTRLGLSKAVSLGLESTFPNFTRVTDAQTTFIPAIIQGKDVILKGHTGSGKSFGLILALLSKYWSPHTARKPSSPASLLLVPHRDLAYQFMRWIERITTAVTDGPHFSSPVAQVIVRGSEEPSFHVNQLRDNPPNILIGTPQAILDMLHEDEHAINISSLGIVAVDEVDYIIDFIPADASKDRKQKLAAKMRRHPSPGKLLLDRIYASRVRSDGSAAVDGSPQLVVCSATLPTGLRQQLYQNGWFIKGAEVIKVRSEMPVEKIRESEENGAGVGLEAQVVQHCALVFSEDGSVGDIEGAVESKCSSEVEDAYQREVQTWTNVDGSNLPDITAELAERYSVTPSAFNPILMEGIASVFATDVPKVALLVLPASAPVQRAVYDLRMLGVNAFGLDLLAIDRGRKHLIGESRRAIEENPTLLVSTTTSTRGLDLPNLSHVFVWGVQDRNTYVHVAGRVGRFGRGGKVISVLEEKREQGRYLRLLKSIETTPTKFFN